MTVSQTTNARTTRPAGSKHKTQAPSWLQQMLQRQNRRLLLQSTNLRDEADVAGEREVPTAVARLDLVDLAMAWCDTGGGGRQWSQKNIKQQHLQSMRNLAPLEKYKEPWRSMPHTGIVRLEHNHPTSST